MEQFKNAKILAVAHHRNGVCGAPFDVAIVHDGETKKVVILFEEKYVCAVLDIDMLSQDNIRFGENSWRGDQYDGAFREKVKRKIAEMYRKMFKEVST